MMAVMNFMLVPLFDLVFLLSCVAAPSNWNQEPCRFRETR
jgi:hypothetical protein